jgi:uncharacterized protein YjbI with pentapeptide repeats
MTNSAPRELERILTAREKAELRGAVFRDRDMVGVDLSGADLRGTRFERVRLTDCSLAGADLRGAQFLLCELRFVLLARVQLEDTRFPGTTVVEPGDLDEQGRLLIEREGGSFQHAQASAR